MQRPQSLAWRAFSGSATFLLMVAGLMCLSAGTIRFWQGWLALGVLSAAMVLITAALLKSDPALVERRLKGMPSAELNPLEQILHWLMLVGFVAFFVVAGLDDRWGWSRLSPTVVVAGNLLVGLGMTFIFFVFRENSFASAIIEVGSGQKVISSGPYRLVRHPMYAGALPLLVGLPLALGSLRALGLCVPLVAALVWRLIDEERYLRLHLPGYSEYCARTRYRLIPWIF